MNITCLIFGVIFLIAGFLFAIGKLHVLLAAWKKMPNEEKEKIRIMPLCRNIGLMIMLSGALFLINGFWESFRDRWFALSMIIWLVVAGLDVWFITKSKHYQNK